MASTPGSALIARTLARNSRTLVSLVPSWTSSVAGSSEAAWSSARPSVLVRPIEALVVSVGRSACSGALVPSARESPTLRIGAAVAAAVRAAPR